ncbi:4'-phosphopantetheinyl transferase family protein [Mucilaginibacter pedocola]|uniref:Uncharacterized protein n=1 Tax=Mucilaginibacter pedocola TaxID=1792845 RepID=A0A1S9PKR9_9SPHI|nr:4'-phosphopantetheinyl transferase superfamily protein [Mucilaginibacter pedocola]OOQ61562.1 hypothetical protein BC343_00335 [Mucilaginibacter pedocola]
MGEVNIRFIERPEWQQAHSGLFVLAEGEVHVYRIGISANVKHIPAFAATLTQEEAERGQKYHQLKDRQRFVVSRGAQRYILAQYLGKQPAELTFTIGPNKKPYLHTPGGIDIRYNITHAGDCILLAISHTTVGADVEYIDADFPFDDIITGHFSAAEAVFINKNNKAHSFYLLWTRKEALLKATAQGLGEHLQETPSLDGEHTMPASLSGSDRDWEVVSFELPDEHIGSVVSTNGTIDLKFFEVTF